MHAVYIVNLILPFVLIIYAKLTRLEKKYQDNIVLFIYTVFAILIVGTRSIETGADTISYFNFYKVALQQGQEVRAFNYFEPLFSLIGIICAKLNFSFEMFNIIIALLTMIFFSKAIAKSSANVMLSIFLYITFSLFDQMMNQVRQGFAMMIVLYAVSFLTSDNKKKFVLWVLVAALVHLSSLIALILLIFYKFEINKKTISVYIVMGICCLLFSTFIFQFISSNFDYGHYLTESWRYGAYNKKAILNLIVRIIMLISVMFFSIEICEQNKSMNVYYHMVFLCTVFQILTVMNNAVGRITTIFFISYLILIPEIVVKSRQFKNIKQFIYPIMFGIMLLYYLVYNGVLSGDEMNYKSTWL